MGRLRGAFGVSGQLKKSWEEDLLTVQEISKLYGMSAHEVRRHLKSFDTISPEVHKTRRRERTEIQWAQIEPRFRDAMATFTQGTTRVAAIAALSERFPELAPEVVELFFDRAIGSRKPRANFRNPDRDRQIVETYEREGLTLDELGIRFGVTRERIRQILKRNGAKSKAEVSARLQSELNDRFDENRSQILAELRQLAINEQLTMTEAVKIMADKYSEFPREMVGELVKSSRVPFTTRPSPTKSFFTDVQLELAVLACFGLNYHRALATNDYSEFVEPLHEKELRTFSKSDSFPTNVPIDKFLNAIGFTSLKRSQKVLDAFSHADYERRRKEIWSQNGWESGSGGRNWPPTQQTISKRLGGGYWNDAMRSLGFPESVKKGRPRVGYLHDADSLSRTLGAFLAYCAEDNGVNAPTVAAFETWRLEEESRGNQHASPATIRNYFKSWNDAIHSARSRNLDWLSPREDNLNSGLHLKAVAAEGTECIHGMQSQLCDLCKTPPAGWPSRVYITAGGNHFHATNDCVNLTKGQEEAAALGFTKHEIVQAAWQTVSELRKPCRLCFRHLRP